MTIEPEHLTSQTTSRRKFLGLAAAGATATSLGAGAFLLGRDSEPKYPSADNAKAGSASSGPGKVASNPPAALTEAGPLADRTLIVIELEGGNDGLATLIPYGNSALQSLRPDLLHDEAELLMLDDEMALNPGLAGLHEQGLAIIEGIGSTEGILSHFEMSELWWEGATSANDRRNTGFLGRLCDELDVGAPLTGLSIGGNGNIPQLVSEKATTLGLADADAGWFFREEGDFYEHFRRSLLAMSASTSGSELLNTARHGSAQAIDFADMLGGFDPEERPVEYPGTDLANSLAVTANLMRNDSGVRIIHVPFGGFDTHDDQRGTHDYLLMELDEALVAFRNDLATDGLDASTLIATTSEFGRRPKSSDSGSDHGNASVAMLAGPITLGRHGESPSLTRLDEEDNLAPTASMAEYYATLAAWFEIDPSLVLSGKPEPLSGILI